MHPTPTIYKLPACLTVKFSLLGLPLLMLTHRNGDGRISFSEFRVMMGGYPLVSSLAKQNPNIIKQK